MKFTFRKKYLLLSILLFLVEVGIALFVKDRFVRPYVGDFLVVILLYFFVRTFLDAPPRWVALGVLTFAFAVEVGQHFQLVKLLGLNDSELARTVIGTGFDWGDLLAYALGVGVVFLVDTAFQPTSE